MYEIYSNPIDKFSHLQNCTTEIDTVYAAHTMQGNSCLLSPQSTRLIRV